MANQSSTIGDQDNTAVPKAQAELLRTVLESDQYPWLPGDTAGADDPLEAAGQALEFSDEEAARGWQGLAAQLSQLWGESAEAATHSPLHQKFADRLPAAIIAHISHKAQQLVGNGQTSSQISSQISRQSSGQSVLDQMVACVQDVITTVGEADLQVLGRPMAMAMRGSSTDEFIDATVQSIRTAQWDALSPIEQAKLSLAAARYAISCQ